MQHPPLKTIYNALQWSENWRIKTPPLFEADVLNKGGVLSKKREQVAIKFCC